MKYTLTINQFGICDLADELGLELSSISSDALLFLDFLIYFKDVENKIVCEKDGEEYLWVNYTYAIKENPFLCLNKSKITRLFAELREWGLVKTIQDSSNKLYYAFGDNFEKLVSNLPFQNETDYFKNETDYFKNETDYFKNETSVSKSAHENNKYIEVNSFNENLKEINIRERERAREEKESFVINDNLNSYDYLQLQIKEKANMIFKLKCENEFLSYDEWEKWCFYRQAISKLDIVSLEFVLAENIKDLNAFGEKANESIALTISGGYKKPLLPKSNAPTPSVSQKSTQGTSTSTGKGELKEWQITSGIYTAPNWKLLRPSDTIMLDAYTGEFLDYKKAFFAICNANLGDYALDKYKTNGMPEWEREVREYLNIAIDERITFLKKQKEEKEKIAV